MITDNDSKRMDDPLLSSGITQFRQIKRTWHLCPKCCYNSRRFTVDKFKRKCNNCGCRLYFDGDDCNISTTEHEDFYIWHKSIFGLTGWYHSSYFKPIQMPGHYKGSI